MGWHMMAQDEQEKWQGEARYHPSVFIYSVGCGTQEAANSAASRGAGEPPPGTGNPFSTCEPESL